MQSFWIRWIFWFARVQRVIQGHGYLLFCGIFHHQHVTPSLSVVLEATTLSSKGMKAVAPRGCFQGPGLYRARALPLMFHGLYISWWESHWNKLGTYCVMSGWRDKVQCADFQQCTTRKLQVKFLGGKMRAAAQEIAHQIALRSCSNEAQGNICNLGEGRVHVIMYLFFVEVLC